MGATETREYITTTHPAADARWPWLAAQHTGQQAAPRGSNAKAEVRARAAVVLDEGVCADQYCAVRLGVWPGASLLGS